MDKDLRSQKRVPRPSGGTRRQDGRYELPYAKLQGGDSLLGGNPCAPGHAGRKAASLASSARRRTDRLDARARRVAQAVIATTLLVVAQIMGVLSCSTTPALAASGNDPRTVTLDGGQISRHALDGQEAYCCNAYLSSPPNGTVLTNWHSGSLALDYVLYHSDGGADGAEPHYSWNVAKWVVWVVMGSDAKYLDYYANGVTLNPNRATNHKLYDEAMAFQRSGGVGPERGCSRIYDPPSSAYQPLCVCAPLVGNVRLDKRSAVEGISSADACYSLEGAEYTVYQDEACSRPVGKLVTDAKGKAELKNLASGTYWVRETKSPTGFAKDEGTYKIDVSPTKVAVVNGSSVNDTPLYLPMDTLVQKGDHDLVSRGMTGQAQGDATFAGAQFVVKRFANTTGSLNGASVRTWTIATGADGTATLDDEHLVSGDELYRDASGKAVLPLGTYVLQESAAPEGYLPNTNLTCTFVVYQDGSVAKKKTLEGSMRPDGSAFLVEDEVIRGGVALGKVDAQRSDHTPQGAAQLEGAVIAIRIEGEQPVIVKGTTYPPGSTVTSLTIGADGTARTASDLLPYGTYRAVEVEAPKGYLLTREGTWSRSFMIREDGVVVDLTDEAYSVPNLVKRGDLEFVKVDGRSMRRMAGVPFVIESLTTGERHVVVTDENGYCSTSASFVPHSQATNANDTLLSGLSTQGEEWAVTAPEEQPTDALPGDEEVADEPAEEPGEEAATEDATQNEEVEDGATDEAAPQEDVSEEEVLAVEEPEAEEQLPDDLQERDDDEETPSDLVAQAELTTPVSGVWFSGGTDKEVPVNDMLGALPYDTYQVTELRSPANEGYELLSFQVVLTRDNYVIDGGTLDNQAFPTIQTTLAVVETSEQTSLWQLSDVVSFADVKTDGTEYEVRGSLHLVGEDGSDQGVVTDAQGNVATSSVTLLPKASNGTVEVPFEIDVNELRGRTVVAFEELWCEGELVATHEDITDEDQSVSIPNIATTLTDEEGAKETDGTDSVTLVDHVSYEGLVPGKTYLMTGTLMNKKTGEPVADEDGNAITAEASFAPEEPSGTVDITFVFDGSLCRGTTVVAFETLKNDGIELAVHADIEDEGQSVNVPKIATSAVDGKDGDKELLAEESACIVDEVTYEGLIPGKEYVLTGCLMDRVTGESLMRDGSPLAVTTSLVPDSPDGVAEMRFELDASELAGKELTVFETLLSDDRVVARHEDLSSDEQSVRIPKIGTTAQTADGEKSAEASKKLQVVDVISYEGLTPGREYVASGVLHLRDAGGKDLGPLKDTRKNDVTASVTFTPESTSGTVEVPFTVDVSELGGKDLVAFEVVMVSEDKSVVATHEDITDGSQSVSVKEPPENPPSRKKLPKTGDVFVPLKGLVVSGVLTLACAAVMRYQDAKERRGSHQRP